MIDGSVVSVVFCHDWCMCEMIIVADDAIAGYEIFYDAVVDGARTGAGDGVLAGEAVDGAGGVGAVADHSRAVISLAPFEHQPWIS